MRGSLGEEKEEECRESKREGQGGGTGGERVGKERVLEESTTSTVHSGSYLGCNIYAPVSDTDVGT